MQPPGEPGEEEQAEAHGEPMEGSCRLTDHRDPAEGEQEGGEDKGLFTAQSRSGNTAVGHFQQTPEQGSVKRRAAGYRPEPFQCGHQAGEQSGLPEQAAQPGEGHHKGADPDQALGGAGNALYKGGAQGQGLRRRGRSKSPCRCR